MFQSDRWILRYSEIIDDAIFVYYIKLVILRKNIVFAVSKFYLTSDFFISRIRNILLGI